MRFAVSGLVAGAGIASCDLDAATLTASPTAADSGSAAPAGALAGATFYVDPASNARKTVDAWRLSRPADAELLDKVASQPTARWFSHWSGPIFTAVDRAVERITAAGALPVLVAYNIPQRDCGGYSGGNAPTPAQYRVWIADFARAIGARSAVVVLEPDALAAMGCLSSADRAVRVSLLAEAVRAFAALPATRVYLDAGHPGWQSAATMAQRLEDANVGDAAGFSLNVSNFFGDAANVAYGEEISWRIGGKPFVVDASRNGLGPAPNLEWCNPEGRALGRRPSATTGHRLVDAYLWIKPPGESDGPCRGAPNAGAWMPEYALDLARRAAY